MAAKSQRVQVTRSFRHRGEDLGTGSVLDLDLPLAQELRQGKRVEFVPSDTKVVSLPLPAKKRAPSQTDHVAALGQLVEALTALVEKLSKPAKEKASA